MISMERVSLQKLQKENTNTLLIGADLNEKQKEYGCHESN